MCYISSVSRTLFFFSIAACLFACSSSPPSPSQTTEPIGKCVPNQTLVCLCGLDQGSQHCTAEGELTPCVCPTTSPTPTDTTTPAPTPPGPPPPSGPKCGNGVLETGEACDDGNTKDGDGCSAACLPDGAPASGKSCPGQPVAVWKGTPIEFGASTAPYTDAAYSSCDLAFGPDRIFAITPKSDGFLTIDLTLGDRFDAVLSVRGDCARTSSELACVVSGGEPVSRVVQVKKDTPIFLYVDGSSATDAGAFALSLKLL